VDHGLSQVFGRRAGFYSFVLLSYVFFFAWLI